MTQRRLVHWTIDPDVLDYDGELQFQGYRTVTANSDTARTITVGSVVLCAEFEFLYGRGHIVRAIGRVKRKSAGTTRRRRVRLDPFWQLSSPIDLAQIMEGSDRYVAKAIEEAFLGDPAHPKSFTARSADIILKAVARASDEAKSLIDRLSLTKNPLLGLTECAYVKSVTQSVLPWNLPDYHALVGHSLIVVKM